MPETSSLPVQKTSCQTCHRRANCCCIKQQGLLKCKRQMQCLFDPSILTKETKERTFEMPAGCFIHKIIVNANSILWSFALTISEKFEGISVRFVGPCRAKSSFQLTGRTEPCLSFKNQPTPQCCQGMKLSDIEFIPCAKTREYSLYHQRRAVALVRSQTRQYRGSEGSTGSAESVCIDSSSRKLPILICSNKN